MMTMERCPNCIQFHDTISDNSACLLHALIAHILHDRGEMSCEAGHALLQSTDVERFWAALRPVVDQLRDGAFTRQIDYAVRWEIDIVASSPEDAAERARTIMLDPASSATVFDVRPTRDESRSADVIWTRVDLSRASFATVDGDPV